VFIAGVSDTGNKLFTSVNDTGDKLSPVSLLSAMNYCPCLDTGDYALSRIFIDSMTLAINLSAVTTTRQ
jgi:hypothetical protein